MRKRHGTSCLRSCSLGLIAWILLKATASLAGEYSQPYGFTSVGGGASSGETYALRTMSVGQIVADDAASGSDYGSRFSSGYVLAKAVNNAPVVEVELADQTDAQDNAVNLDISGVFSDLDKDDLTYTATGLPASLSLDSKTGVISGTLTNADALSSPYSVELTATDPSSKEVSYTFTMTVENVNDPPVADAGSDQTVDEGDHTALDGSSSSDPDENIESYKWSQTGGPRAALSSDSAIEPTFTAPDVGPDGDDLIFDLTVRDSEGLESTDTVTVRVNALDQQPFLMADVNPVPEYAMPDRAFVIPLYADGQQADCSDLTFSFTSTTKPDDMAITPETGSCEPEIRWVPGSADAGSEFLGIEAIASDSGDSSEPVSFNVTVLESLTIDPAKAVLLRTVRTNRDGSPAGTIEETRNFEISGGLPHSSTRYYTYTLTGPGTDDKISGTIEEDGSGEFHFQMSTSDYGKGKYRITVHDSADFKVISGEIEVKEVTVEVVTPTEVAEPDGSTTLSVADASSPLNGTEISVPESASDTVGDLTIGKVDDAPTISGGEAPLLVIDITPASGSTSTTLSEPIEITLPYDSGLDPNEIRVYTFNTDTNLWTLVPLVSVNDDQTVTFRIDHFSLFTVAEPETLTTSLSGGTTRQDFRMISFPANPDDPDLETTFSSVLGEYDDTIWRSAAYNFRTGKYDEINTEEFASTHPLEPGKSYWIISSEDASISLKGMLLNSALPYETVLHPGWNMIANPFNRSITLGDISVSSDAVTYEGIAESPLVDNWLHRFDPQDDGSGETTWYTKITELTESLASYEGYWIFSKSSSDIIIRFESPSDIARQSQDRSVYRTATRYARRSLNRFLDTVASVAYALTGSTRTPPAPPASPSGGSGQYTIGVLSEGGGGGGCFIHAAQGR